MQDGGTGNSGFALLSVLVFLMVVTAAITPFVLAARTDFAVAASRYENERLNFLAEDIAATIANRLSVPLDVADGVGLPVNSTPLRAVCGNLLVDVAIQDQSGLIDLNAAQPGLMEAGFVAIGFGRTPARRLSRLAEFYRRPPGAAKPGRIGEKEIPNGLKMGPFEAIEELYELRAFRNIPIEKINHAFTVYARVPTITAKFMPAELAKVLPGQPSARYPYVSVADQPSQFFRIAVSLNKRGSTASGYSGAVYELARGENGGFRLLEPATNPSFLGHAAGSFKPSMDCDRLFGPQTANWLSSVQ